MENDSSLRMYDLEQTNIGEAVDYFRRIKNISLNELSTRSGISTTNLKRVLGGDNISLLVLVRLVAAMWDDGIADSLFETKKNVLRCIKQTIDREDICSATDFAALVILLKDYFNCGNDHKAETHLNRVFRVLDSEVAIARNFDKSSERTNHTSAELYLAEQDKATFEESLEYQIDQRVLRSHLKSYYDDTFWMPSFLSDVDASQSIGLDDYRPFMKDGETMVWSDISNMLAQYRQEYNLTTTKLVHSSVALRMENKTNRAYKYRDVMDLDEEMEMGGAFFSVCYNATRNSHLLSKICSFMDLDTSDFQKIDEQKQFEKGIHSFFSMLRYLERNRHLTNGPLKVLRVLRQPFIFSFEEAETSPIDKWYLGYQLQKMVEDEFAFFPVSALKYYRK